MATGFEKRGRKSEADLTVSESVLADLYLPPVLPCKRRQAEQRQGRQYKTLKKMIQQEPFGADPHADSPNYLSIEAPPPRYPPKKYCDMTGLEAPYTDPKTGLRYANAASYGLVKRLTEPYVQGYLALRKSARGALK